MLKNPELGLPGRIGLDLNPCLGCTGEVSLGDEGVELPPLHT
jgi:hypothetical protein